MSSIFGNVPKGSTGEGKTQKRWVNLQQAMTQKEIKNGNPGMLYRKDRNGEYIATKHITGFVAFVTQKRAYVVDKEARCWSPDAEMGKGKPGVHGVDPSVRECRGCPFREKEEGQSSPCTISYEVSLVEAGTGEVLTLELRRTSYPCGNKLMNILRSQEDPERTPIKFSGKKIKSYYIFDVELAEEQGTPPENLQKIIESLHGEWQERRFSTEDASKEAVEESPKSSPLEGDIPF